MPQSYASDTHKWCLDNLEAFTGYSASNDVINYMLSIDEESELREFLQGISDDNFSVMIMK